MVAPLPDGVYRIVAPVADAPEEPSGAFIQQILDTAGSGVGRMVVTDVIWGSRFRIHHRVADTYRAGRLLLAGDAAHVHSPAGGQGMNLGIQDAVALADALAAVLAGGPDSLLDDYSAARRPIAKGVVTMTDRLTRLATLPRAARPIRNAAISLVGRVPAVRARPGPTAQRSGLPLIWLRPETNIAEGGCVDHRSPPCGERPAADVQRSAVASAMMVDCCYHRRAPAAHVRDARGAGK